MRNKSLYIYAALIGFLEFSSHAAYGQLDLDQEMNLKTQDIRSKSEYCESLKRQVNYVGSSRFPMHRLASGSIYSLDNCEFKKIGTLDDIHTYPSGIKGTLSTQFKLKDSDYPAHFGSNQNMLLCYFKKWVRHKNAPTSIFGLNPGESDYSVSCLERAVYCDERTGHHGLVAFTAAPYMELKQGICRLQPETF